MDRYLLALNVAVVGIQELQLAAAQRQCQEPGPIYAAVLAKQTEGKGPRSELVALKKRQEDWFLTQGRLRGEADRVLRVSAGSSLSASVR